MQRSGNYSCATFASRLSIEGLGGLHRQYVIRTYACGDVGMFVCVRASGLFPFLYERVRVLRTAPKTNISIIVYGSNGSLSSTNCSSGTHAPVGGDFRRPYPSMSVLHLCPRRPDGFGGIGVAKVWQITTFALHDGCLHQPFVFGSPPTAL